LHQAYGASIRYDTPLKDTLDPHYGKQKVWVYTVSLCGFDNELLIGSRAFIGGMPSSECNVSAGISKCHCDGRDDLTLVAREGAPIASHISI